MPSEKAKLDQQKKIVQEYQEQKLPFQNLPTDVKDMTPEPSPEEKQLKQESNNVEALLDSIDSHTQETQKDINNYHDTPQQGIDELAAMSAPQESMQSSYYQKVRNTGIGYFDNKKELSLFDAYLAKKLGLDTKYTFHKIDIKSDNTHKVQNYTTSMNAIASGLKNAKDSIILSLKTADKGIFQALKHQFEKATFGAYNTRDGKEQQIIRKSLAANLYNAISKDGRVIAKELEDINSIIPAVHSQQSIMPVIERIIEKTISNAEVDLMNLSGANANPKLLAGINNELNKLKNVQNILTQAKAQKRTFSVNETIQIVHIMGLQGGW